ncbi:MAG: hypothetical protein AB1649_08585 [Chloroflexota bacterium]
MKPVLTFPFHDPTGTMFLHLQRILPDLKAHFGHLYLCPHPSTLQQAEHMRQLSEDGCITIFQLEEQVPFGQRLKFLYRQTADAAHPDQPVHMCFLDRLSFALENGYREQFLRDIDSLTVEDLPLIYHRSPKAWDTHPQNYRALEGFVTMIGQTLFGKTLDYGWCHLVATAGQLRKIMPHIQRTDLSMVAEMVYYLQENIHTREVDWLAWEDPFILGRDPAELRHEREQSNAETQKRLSYVLPMVEMLVHFSKNGHS